MSFQGSITHLSPDLLSNTKQGLRQFTPDANQIKKHSSNDRPGLEEIQHKKATLKRNNMADNLKQKAIVQISDFELMLRAASQKIMCK